MYSIVVIEDEAAIASVLREALEEAGYRVSVACDGRAGLLLVRTIRPDLVLSDLMLPLLDGIELARCLREDPDLAHIALVLMSASRRVDPEAGRLYQAFLPKPFLLDDLLEVIAQQLAGTAARHDRSWELRGADDW